MPLRAIDFHVHLPTPDWLDGSMAGYVEAAEAYFRSPVQRQSGVGRWTWKSIARSGIAPP